MKLDQLHALLERLRKSAIGEPEWIAEKQAFEYQHQSAKVTAVLKLARAAQGLTALELLCRSGLFIDFGVAIQCVNDSVEDAYFVLEEYPKTSSNVDKFVKAFFENTIDGYLFSETPPVPREKIRNAVVRILKGGQDEQTRKITENIYKTFLGLQGIEWAILHGHSGGSMQERTLRRRYSSSRNP